MKQIKQKLINKHNKIKYNRMLYRMIYKLKYNLKNKTKHKIKVKLSLTINKVMTNKNK